MRRYQGCPRWRNEFGKNPADSFRDMIEQVGMPVADPVYGKAGPLMQLWNARRPLAKL